MALLHTLNSFTKRKSYQDQDLEDLNDSIIVAITDFITLHQNLSYAFRHMARYPVRLHKFLSTPRRPCPYDTSLTASLFNFPQTGCLVYKAAF